MMAAFQRGGLPQTTRTDIYARVDELANRIKKAEHPEDFERTAIRLVEIVQADRKLDLESIRVALEIEKMESGKSDTQINITQQVAVANQQRTPEEEAAIMDGSVIPPNLTLFGKKINQSANGHFGGNNGDGSGQHDKDE
jgi:hypothetical protein